MIRQESLSRALTLINAYLSLYPVKEKVFIERKEKEYDQDKNGANHGYADTCHVPSGC